MCVCSSMYVGVGGVGRRFRSMLVYIDFLLLLVSETLFRCTECKFAIYICMEVRMSPLSVARGTLLREGGRVRPQPFF